jgi:pilus assembly protein Flp/PilA
METMSRIRTLCSTVDRQIKRFCADESAATAVEYGLIAAGIAAAVITTVFSLGTKLKETFYDKIAAAFP